MDWLKEKMEVIRATNGKYIVTDIIHQGRDEYDDFYDKLDGYNGEWGPAVRDALDLRYTVWGFQEQMFYQVVNVDNLRTEWIVEGEYFLSPNWEHLYETEEEMEENEDLSLDGEKVWVRVFKEDGDVYAIGANRPEEL